MSDPGHGAPRPGVPEERKRGLRSRWPTIVGWVVSAAALGYVLSKLQLSELSKSLSGVTWWLMGAAVVAEVLPRLLEAVRWRSLLQPICTRFVGLLQAIYIGTVYSSILPLSGGDVVRGVIVARNSAANITQVLSTEVLERIVDALAIVLVVWFALRGLVLPQSLVVVRTILEAGVGLAALGGVYLALRRQRLLSRLQRWNPGNRMAKRVRLVTLDLVQALGWTRPRALLVAMEAALGAALVNVGAYWLMLHAYHIPLSPIQAAGVFAIVIVGTFLPGTPGNVGSWQFFCTVALQLFGIGAAQAAGFSVVAYFIWTVPPLLIGLAAFILSPFKRSELRTGRPQPPIQTGGVCKTDPKGTKGQEGGDS